MRTLMYKESFLNINFLTTLHIKQLKHTIQTNPTTLVFLHDALGSITQWKNFCQVVAAQTKLDAVIFDRQGHGGSSPLIGERDRRYMHREAYEILPALFEQLGIEKPILIGHSDGGTIALLYGGKYQLTGIISIAAHTFVEEITLQGLRKTRASKEKLVSLLSLFHADKAEQLFNLWNDTWLSEEFRDWNILEEIQMIKDPVLVVQGEEDEYGSIKQVDSIIRSVQGKAESFLVPGAGHMPHLSHMELVVEEITAFVNRCILGNHEDTKH